MAEAETVVGPGAIDGEQRAMPDELPPNKVCPTCGAENLATAARCLECNAALSVPPPSHDPILRIGDKTSPIPPRRRFLSRGFLRLMSVPALSVIVWTMWPEGAGKVVAIPCTFLVATCLAIVAGVAADPIPGSGSRPHAGWVFVDGILRGLGCLFSVVAGFVVSLGAFFLAVCYCNPR